MAEERLPLDGLLVADFSRVLAGPLATSSLADIGATVVKVERPGRGDDTRQWGPPWTDHSSAYFECANRSKRSIELDLDDPGDLHLAQALALRADVLVENFLHGTLPRRGLGYNDLSAQNPGLVYCSITGFGSQGGAQLAGYDFLVQAVGGLMSITGSANGDPMKVGVALVDVLTSKDAVIGILAALRSRSDSGHGQHVEVNLLSSLLGSLANQAGSYLATDQPPGRMGNLHPSIAPYETFRCNDGLLAVCCGNDSQFARMAEVLGREELAHDPRFRTNPARVSHRRELIAQLEHALKQDSVGNWTHRLGAVGVPAGGVNDIKSAFELATSLGLDPVVDVGEDRPVQVRHPVSYSRTPVRRYTAPPTLGEHNDDIRTWLNETSRKLP